MIRTSISSAKVGFRDQDECEKLISYLNTKGYFAIIRGMIKGIFSLANLPEPNMKTINEVNKFVYSPYVRASYEILGDIFFYNNLVFVLIPIRQSMLQASVIGYRESENDLKNFCSEIENGIKNRLDGRRVRGMEFKWNSQRLPSLIYTKYGYSASRRYIDDMYDDSNERETEIASPKIKTIKPLYSLSDIKIAKLLTDIKIRDFILRMAQVSKIRSNDAKKDLNINIINNLISLRLIEEEYLLICKKDQHTICSVPSKNHIIHESTASLKCNVCDRSFSDENLQTIYKITDKCRNLIEKSLWMQIWITELLKENGIREDTISWKVEASGEELDIMVEDFDSRIFFELKDREFGLGDAYPFVYRIPRFKGRFGIVATMDKVSPDAKDFFKEVNQKREYPIKVKILEGTDGIKQGIIELVEDLSNSQARRLVQIFSRRIGLNFWPIIENWLNIKNQ